ncbi:hypothetical protein LX36DRAFT_675874 [Colletotrichum falcatum]|nr:hypothetical protein LX36DRAFT_675874 [Colletotrichum falcatum]
MDLPHSTSLFVTQTPTTNDKRRLRNKATSESRRRCAANLVKYHDKLNKLCGGCRSWLPKGVHLDSLTYDTVLDLLKIIKWSLPRVDRVESLWEPNGHLHNVAYCKKSLDSVWKRLSKQRTDPDAPYLNLSSNDNRQQD